MKKCLIILVLTLQTVFINGQGGYSCSGLPVEQGCNYIPNPGFLMEDNSVTVSAFSLNKVLDWKHGHGTPDINRYGLSLPDGVPQVNYASFHVVSQVSSPPSIDLASSEGIAAKISPLTPSKEYVLSFFRKATTAVDVPGTPAARDFTFKIILAKCEDFQNSSAFIPSYPANYQTIYCETIGQGEFDWGQAFIKFTAADDYNLIWVFAVQNEPTSVYTQANTYVSFMHFAYPQLMKVDDLAITWPNTSCESTTLSPTCHIINAEYHWTGPNGFEISQQHVATNAVNDFGWYYLEMTVPGITSNNSCSESNPTLYAEAELPEYSAWGNIDITSYAIYDRFDENEGYESDYIQPLEPCMFKDLIHNTNELVRLHLESSEPNDNVWEVYIHSFAPGPVYFRESGQAIVNVNPVSVSRTVDIDVMLRPDAEVLVEVRLTSLGFNESKSVFIRIVPLPSRIAITYVQEQRPDENSIFLYPNPARSNFKIRTGKQIREVLINTIDGRVVKRLTSITNSSQIDISELKSGTYLIQTIFKDQTRQSKILVKN